MNERNLTRREFLKKAAMTAMTASAISALGFGSAYTSHSDETDELVGMHPEIESALSTLQQREALVIKLRFGLCDGRPATLAQIGKKLGISRERVRHIESDALRKLSPLSARKLDF